VGCKVRAAVCVGAATLRERVLCRRALSIPAETRGGRSAAPDEPKRARHEMAAYGRLRLLRRKYRIPAGWRSKEASNRRTSRRPGRARRQRGGAKPSVHRSQARRPLNWGESSTQSGRKRPETCAFSGLSNHLGRPTHTCYIIKSTMSDNTRLSDIILHRHVRRLLILGPARSAAAIYAPSRRGTPNHSGATTLTPGAVFAVADLAKFPFLNDGWG